MRVFQGLWGYASVSLLVACGADPKSSAPSAPSGTTETTTFEVPPLKAGYTRIVAPVVEGIEAGGDSIQCQYVLEPFDRDMDVLDVVGYQSKGGHHATAYAVRNGAAVGTSRECNEVDNTSIGGFLGGVGGEAGGKAKLPDGVVFRLTKGSSIMLNAHFLNTTLDSIDGQTVLDVKFAEVDPSRLVASIFVNFTSNFTVAAQTKTTADAVCTVPKDMKLLSFTNHMHTYGVRSNTSLVNPAAGGAAPTDVHTDALWTSDMQFNPVFTEWTVADPLLVQKGDVLTTHCEWENGTTNPVNFPDEMCVGFGFFLADTPASPLCLDGTWTE
ncbi:MAG TPA: hypothetical protein VHE30_25210 [Polyangiaceae bacterium]|nr:hypothetical protein [Polyangiaceae bacterium]